MSSESLYQRVTLWFPLCLITDLFSQEIFQNQQVNKTMVLKSLNALKPKIDFLLCSLCSSAVLCPLLCGGLRQEPVLAGGQQQLSGIMWAIIRASSQILLSHGDQGRAVYCCPCGFSTGCGHFTGYLTRGLATDDLYCNENMYATNTTTGML